MNAAVVSRNDGFERRARVLPWGIQVEVWRLVETLNLPTTAASLPIHTLFPDEAAGALPSTHVDEDKTLENVVDHGADSEIELAREDEDERAPR
jgi:hypothetical protein